jgi:hypothetical protein
VIAFADDMHGLRYVLLAVAVMLVIAVVGAWPWLRRPVALEQAGYGAIWHGQKGANGVASLARGLHTRELRCGLPGDPDDDTGRYVEAEVDELAYQYAGDPEVQDAPRNERRDSCRGTSDNDRQKKIAAAPAIPYVPHG